MPPTTTTRRIRVKQARPGGEIKHVPPPPPKTLRALQCKRRRDVRPDKSFDIDRDGVVDQRDFFIAKQFVDSSSSSSNLVQRLSKTECQRAQTAQANAYRDTLCTVDYATFKERLRRHHKTTPHDTFARLFGASHTASPPAPHRAMRARRAESFRKGGSAASQKAQAAADAEATAIRNNLHARIRALHGPKETSKENTEDKTAVPRIPYTKAPPLVDANTLSEADHARYQLGRQAVQSRILTLTGAPRRHLHLEETFARTVGNGQLATTVPTTSAAVIGKDAATVDLSNTRGTWTRARRAYNLPPGALNNGNTLISPIVAHSRFGKAEFVRT